jgi:hypothetical protein
VRFYTAQKPAKLCGDYPVYFMFAPLRGANTREMNH